MTRRLVLVLAPLLLATAAMAQPAGRHEHHGAPPAEMKARHEAMQKQRIEDLKIVLRLRPDQEAALAAFVDSHHRGERKELPKPDGKPLTTPERLDRMEKRHAEMTAQHERARQALAKFYAALSPDQQKVFDALHRLQGPHGGGMGHGGRGRFVLHHGPGGPDGHGPMVRHELPR